MSSPKIRNDPVKGTDPSWLEVSFNSGNVSGLCKPTQQTFQRNRFISDFDPYWAQSCKWGSAAGTALVTSCARRKPSSAESCSTDWGLACNAKEKHPGIPKMRNSEKLQAHRLLTGEVEQVGSCVRAGSPGFLSLNIFGYRFRRRKS